MNHWRELWQPTLFDRRRLESWLEKGGKELRTRIREATVAILDAHQPKPLPASVDAEIAYILRQ